MPVRTSRCRPAAAVATGLLVAVCAGAFGPDAAAAPAPETRADGTGAAAPSIPAPPDGATPGREEHLAADRARLEALAAVYAGYYGRNPEMPARLLRVGLTPDDVSVTLWLAAKAAADPNAIASARVHRRAPWWQIMRAYRVGSRALRVRLDRPAYGPYAHPYRVLEGRAKGPLTDAEIRDLVQLRLLTEYYRLRPSRVVAGRAAGRSGSDLILEAHRTRGAKPPGRPFGRRS